MDAPPEDNPFILGTAFKHMLRSKAEKTQALFAQLAKPPLFSTLIQKAQALPMTESQKKNLPECYEIKSFEDVLKLY
jgi:hypothetical protein